ncbi:MAG: HupE/UreJ family protein [Pseudomonadota bacterium]
MHIAETEAGEIVILVRMPAPLALLPSDWQGEAETRLPPFSFREGQEILLDLDATRSEQALFHRMLTDGLSVWLNEQLQEISIGRTQFWPDADRPGFGTLKSALRALDETVAATSLPYFDTTLDVEFILPARGLDAAISLSSQLGATFQVIERFGTVIKLHRDGGTETQALIGVLDAAFPSVQSTWEQLLDIAWIGAEHIYLGFDHLAMILLIAVAAHSWRQALLWASAFTVGHVVTLAAGLYGFAPQTAWFIASVEFLILASILVAGAAIVLKLPHLMSWPTLLTIGLIHGYGFASAASVALFAGEVDALSLLAFAVGLELCQLAVYLAILPLILTLDRFVNSNGFRWRQPVALCLAAAAGVAVFQQLMQATGFSVA